MSRDNSPGAENARQRMADALSFSTDGIIVFKPTEHLYSFNSSNNVRYRKWITKIFNYSS